MLTNFFSIAALAIVLARATPMPRADACQCPMDRNFDGGTMINTWPQIQCAYSRGACTWDVQVNIFSAPLLWIANLLFHPYHRPGRWWIRRKTIALPKCPTQRALSTRLVLLGHWSTICSVTSVRIRMARALGMPYVSICCFSRTKVDWLGATLGWQLGEHRTNQLCSLGSMPPRMIIGLLIIWLWPLISPFLLWSYLRFYALHVFAEGDATLYE